ncbi:hypothetical protein EP47_08290 [Legionella norrlandica]|uniref:DUF692 domain-containing protein n=2 Tax=Legionella norrlandica TaxID=1498499 RepID=A0A0A2SSN5_9GAMM|nr:hypothetical protein EP47_08290 [Legionella norrlandica]
MPEQDYMDASRPLFESGDVDIIEWSFDMCWGRKIPQPCLDLLTKYSSQGCLLGHGVSFSILTAKRTKRQELWLQYLQNEVNQLNYQRISEHFGFLSTNTFIQGPPLSMPFIPEMLEVGIKNLQQIKQIAKIPIGLENLGFAFCKQDVIEQGKFLTALLEAVDGFLLLDIHNIYCHMINFDMSLDEILDSLPLDRAKEMHISGGSFRSIEQNNRNIYCDSHDAAIPQDLFLLLEKNLSRFSQIDSLIFERLGNTLSNHYEAAQFREDFMTLKSLIRR